MHVQWTSVFLNKLEFASFAWPLTDPRRINQNYIRHWLRCRSAVESSVDSDGSLLRTGWVSTFCIQNSMHDWRFQLSWKNSFTDFSVQLRIACFRSRFALSLRYCWVSTPNYRSTLIFDSCEELSWCISILGPCFSSWNPSEKWSLDEAASSIAVDLPPGRPAYLVLLEGRQQPIMEQIEQLGRSWSWILSYNDWRSAVD